MNRPLILLSLLPAMGAAGSISYLATKSMTPSPAGEGTSSVDVRARVTVPGSTFTMGSEQGAADERPVHKVSLGAFAIDRFEVTNGRFAACVDAGRCVAPKLTSSATRTRYYGNADFQDYPVLFVSWKQAEQFCAWDGGRLPSEAEWEHAARGAEPTPRTFPWGNETPDCTLANLGGPGGCVGDTDKVGRRPKGKSPYGAEDMAGNVWEWVSDWYEKDFYAASPLANPTGPSDGKLKVMRGGCWMSGKDSLRVSCRKAELPDTWAPNVGFRCAYSQTKGGAR